jgi:hypothetical protein
MYTPNSSVRVVFVDSHNKDSVLFVVATNPSGCIAMTTEQFSVKRTNPPLLKELAPFSMERFINMPDEVRRDL